MDVVERAHAGPSGQCGRRQSEGHGHLQVRVHHVGAAAADERDQPGHGGGVQRAADPEVLRLQADLAQQRLERRAVRASVEDAQDLQIEPGLSGDPAQLGDQGLGSAETERVHHGENSQRTLLVVLHCC